MGVPKFFRFMSERYPCLSQLVQEFEIPEIDNLYLDMNGIIHVCSHPNDFDPHFRISEKAIFSAIFHYIEFIFKTIKPQKLFFLAVDGVAPRAKMNQQRGRRFRSAKEAEVLENQAKAQGQTLPEEARFDSNCITPGTIFMDNLQSQLQYFITDKISNDSLWRDCSVILSGHETPGEGEHKIMDYIRYLKSLPGYNPNTRHCLYGLDADLIMLGLCTHDPHFCLLREEVQYKKSAQKRITTPEETRFYLLHLSLMRDYLDHEFQDLKENLPFPYDLEKIIDDWVLMGFLVGNDFIPHLPDLHINKGALTILYKAYKEVLPTLDGYLNENGFLNLKRLQAYLKKVANFDVEHFEEMQCFAYDVEKDEDMLAKQIGLPSKSASTELELLIEASNKEFELDDLDSTDDEKEKLLEDFAHHKADYYRSKLEFENVNEEVLKSQAEGYVRALQWNLHYYYHGCQSWSWFYPHHYSPYVSDIVNFCDMDIQFEMGRPFLPFHQLLAVLPPASKALLPEAYQPLMTSEASPIIDFYPKDFETDLNGKVQEWEAVVLIPFIHENRLLEAMEKCTGDLTEDEQRRNKHGPMQIFTYTKEDLGVYKSDVFPDIEKNHASVKCIWPHELVVAISDLKFGLPAGYDPTIYMSGFPSLRFIPHTAEMKNSGVKIFNFPSRETSWIITVTKSIESTGIEAAKELLGKVVIVGWPHMVEARVNSIADATARYSLAEDGTVRINEYKETAIAHWLNVSGALVSTYAEKKGIVLGDVPIVVFVHKVDGKKMLLGDNGKVVVENVWSKTEVAFPLQTTLKDIKMHPPTRKIPTTVEELYPPGSQVIILASPNYGAVGEILEAPEVMQKGLVKVRVESVTDPDFSPQEIMNSFGSYCSAQVACRKLGMNQGVFARVTGSFFLQIAGKKATNIGLNLKFTKRNEEKPGYTKKDGLTWFYSDKAINLVRDYWEKFPEIFEYLNANDGTFDVTLKDLYGENSEGKAEEIVAWLKSQPHNDVRAVKCGAEILSTEAINTLETIIDTFRPEISTSVINVKPSRIYKSDLFAGNVPAVETYHKLLDRVVSCQSSYSVPFGLRGYIVGIEKDALPSGNLYDVIFDSSFARGIMIYGSQPYRGYRMPASAFVNISAEKRANPLHKLREVPDVIELRPAKKWQPQTSAVPNQPSAFAFFNQSQKNPYPGLVSQPIINPPIVPPESAANQRFREMWAELGRNKPTPVQAPDTRPALLPTTSRVDPAAALMEALKIKPDEPKKSSREAQADALMKSLSTQPKKPTSYYTILQEYFRGKSPDAPIYKTYPAGGGIMAQVTLPTGNVCWGLPCQNVPDAMESAALQACAHLGLTSMSKDILVQQVKSSVEKSGSQPVGRIQQNNPQVISEPPIGQRRPVQPMYQPLQGARTFYNSNLLQAQNKRSGAPGIPGQTWQTPAAGLPMPPSNWRAECQTTSLANRPGGFIVNASFPAGKQGESASVRQEQSQLVKSNTACLNVPKGLIPRQALTPHRGTKSKEIVRSSNSAAPAEKVPVREAHQNATGKSDVSRNMPKENGKKDEQSRGRNRRPVRIRANFDASGVEKTSNAQGKQSDNKWQ